jgi:hypothetical protein
VCVEKGSWLIVIALQRDVRAHTCMCVRVCVLFQDWRMQYFKTYENPLVYTSFSLKFFFLLGVGFAVILCTLYFFLDVSVVRWYMSS